MAITKESIYREFNIKYDPKTGKIYNSLFGWINPLLVNGNKKLGKGVYTWSMLPTNKAYAFDVNGVTFDTCGTCPCHCEGCYATKGKYNCPSVIQSMGMKTIIARRDIEFMQRAIMAQIRADGIKICRIHAAGDFFNVEYINAWRRIIAECNTTVFWSYTKNAAAEKAFDDLSNVNIVKSIIPGIGFNFGHCDYIIMAYNALKAAGKNVHICRCGIDDMQHCNNCTACSKNDFVLFVEHSTGYNAKSDPAYEAVKQLIDLQEVMA